MKKIFFCLVLVLQLSMALFSITLAGELENTLIMYASIGDLTGVRNVVEKGANINARDALGMTALINTARMGDRNKEVALFLIEKGADVNVYDKNGWTPLMHAARAGSVNIVRALIEKGANLNAQDEYGNTALMHAISSPKADVVRLLIEKGANLNVTDKLGQTALKIARFLKSVGKADFGFGPKQQSEIEEIVRMLERAGAR
ncbi:MAG: ankyrin repeat domain-containing protein [Syntrophorhabdaceae bacterium]|nr:ankyrin repeat domain-containing protein [Syntrophorhabdaceae bacterium]MDD5245719.1 ankyrin repeat domain-containing protein [Syntrophorhabdaceae bacterium]